MTSKTHESNGKKNHHKHLQAKKATLKYSRNASLLPETKKVFSLCPQIFWSFGHI